MITEIHVAIHTTDGTHELTRQAFVWTVPAADLTPPFVDIEHLDKSDVLAWISAETWAEWEGVMERAVTALAEREAKQVAVEVPAHLA